MSRRVLICPDKFKGTLTAPQAAEAIAAGWRRAWPQDTCDLLPISDGGDGFGELLGRHWHAEEHPVETVDAAHRPVRASWWWVPARRTAIIESARVIGLAMLPPGQFHPFELDTFGLAAVLRAAAAKRPAATLIGIGGSATNDAGFGLARGLGWQFLDEAGQPIDRWPDLVRLRRIIGFSIPGFLRNVCIAVDVQNRLLGPRGATRIYGPQKGIRPEDVRPAERALRRLAEVLERSGDAEGATASRAGLPSRAGQVPPLTPPRSPSGGEGRGEGVPRGTSNAFSSRPGAGAAGGLGFGLSVFVGGVLAPGFDLFAQETQFAERVRAASVVVTGEGAIDETTVRMGKGVGQVARLCRRARKPCLGLAGSLNLAAGGAGAFTSLKGIVPELASLEAAKAKAARWLGELAFRVASAWPPP